MAKNNPSILLFTLDVRIFRPILDTSYLNDYYWHFLAIFNDSLLSRPLFLFSLIHICSLFYCSCWTVQRYLIFDPDFWYPFFIDRYWKLCSSGKAQDEFKRQRAIFSLLSPDPESMATLTSVIPIYKVDDRKTIFEEEEFRCFPHHILEKSADSPSQFLKSVSFVLSSISGAEEAFYPLQESLSDKYLPAVSTVWNPVSFYSTYVHLNLSLDHPCPPSYHVCVHNLDLFYAKSFFVNAIQ